MRMKIQTVPAKSILTKSRLPASDYVVNPYIGCSHGCQYCYASFMKRFTGHTEDWGAFVDVKQCPGVRFPRRLAGKTVLLSSVTDPYQPLERRYEATRNLLQLLAHTSCNLEILTKSSLVTRDIALFRQIAHIRIGISLNTLDDSFRKAMEPGASPVARRLETLRLLHEEGFSTYLFLSPIFPALTDLEQIVDQVWPFVDEICFENLNLRGEQTRRVLSYIAAHHPDILPLYQTIYRDRCGDYWRTVEARLSVLELQYPVKFTNYFYHQKIKKGGGLL